jgi:hypothetical protein
MVFKRLRSCPGGRGLAAQAVLPGGYNYKPPCRAVNASGVALLIIL